MKYRVETNCVSNNQLASQCDNTGSISFPIYQTATFAHPGVGESTGYDYSRQQNPTREQLERVVASLENGIDALAFSSGMAAIAVMLELFKPGAHIISSRDLYGGMIRYFDKISIKNGLTITYLDTSTPNLEDFIKKETVAIFIETPTNPMMNITDIQKTAEIAKKHNLLLIVDNTFLSPYFQNPLDLGADIVLHSGTKFLGGHNDTLAGFLIVKRKDLSEELRFLIKTIGSGLAPFDSWLVLRGVKTLAVRMEACQKNAITIANWLINHPKVTKVYYVGLKDHPGYEINKNQSRGSGSMITFQVDCAKTALHVLKSVKLIRFAESLGGVETLITYPTTQTHSDVPLEEREKNGILETTLRLSTGIEHVDDLINDLEQALEIPDKV
ncbi:MAG: PLP-dependent aspartate aminotransferase family protein [Fusobacteriaceae bacterium]|nr:PLP-dependent aspartate aminotransferase family protein [Fusobacteriaceae bacterium]